MNPLDVAGIIANATTGAAAAGGQIADTFTAWTPNAVFGRLALTLDQLRQSIAKGAKDAAVYVGFILIMAICVYIIIKDE